jgi:lipopolysaccharide transport system ATP-binding protein
MTTVIRATGLGKRYELGRTLRKDRTLRESLMESAGEMLRALRPGAERAQERQFWALSDVSFEIPHGEAVGLIGGNGAGKSTLLKVLSRVTAPTVGRSEIRGRVGSLLEVGTGFHPDLTGRENVFLNGAILGMRQVEIARKFDEIVAFAEVEQFIDTQVKRYSSGMYLRLAFSVAAHLEPEVLLVDEVLAVGDAAFQKKCLGKMGDVAAHGRTVVFVSHNLVAVQRLCQRTLWLRGGRLVDDGPTAEVVSRYLQVARSAVMSREWDDVASAPGNDKVRLHRAAVRPTRSDGGEPATHEITTRTPVQIEFEYWNLQAGAHVSLSMHVYNAQDVCIFNAVPVFDNEWRGRPHPAGLFRDVCYVPGDLLNNGTHRVELFVVHDDSTIVHHQPDILTFEVADTAGMRGAFYGQWAGAVRPLLPWKTELLSPGVPAGVDDSRERT